MSAGYYSGCPHCDREDQFLTVGRGNHYCVCADHGTAWFVGTNLFSGWRDETEQERRRDHEQLQQFTIVRPRSGPIVKAPSIADVAGLLRRIGASS